MKAKMLGKMDMKVLAAATLVGAIFITLALGLRLDNVPGPITNHVLNTTDDGAFQDKLILGSFEGKDMTWRFGGQVGDIGGGCMVFQELQRGEPQRCNSVADCEKNIAGLPVFAYCTSLQVFGGEKSCWYKPSDADEEKQYCKKGVRFFPKKTIIGPLDAYPIGENRHMRWRVQTCQSTNNQGLCPAGQGRPQYGPIRDFPPTG